MKEPPEAFVQDTVQEPFSKPVQMQRSDQRSDLQQATSQIDVAVRSHTTEMWYVYPALWCSSRLNHRYSFQCGKTISWACFFKQHFAWCVTHHSKAHLLLQDGERCTVGISALYRHDWAVCKIVRYGMLDIPTVLLSNSLRVLR